MSASQPSVLASVLSDHWSELRKYAGRLVADLSDTEMVSQPIANVTMNHPAWVLSHLAIYGPTLTAILRQEPVEDPKDAPFGRGTIPSSNPSEYLPRDELLASFQNGYDAALAALRECPPDRLDLPSPIERWQSRFPTIAHLAVQFIVRHNALHLGQISAWRRAGGLPPV